MKIINIKNINYLIVNHGDLKNENLLDLINKCDKIVYTDSWGNCYTMISKTQFLEKIKQES